MDLPSHLTSRNIFSFIKSNWILILLVVLGLGIRLFRLEQMASYDFDQEYVTNFVLDVVREYPIRYAGQGLSIQGLFMGAWYFYLMVPGYLITGLYPLGGFVTSILLGTGIIVGYYLVTKTMFSKEAGLIAAFFRAVSFYSIQADWAMVPSYSSDLSILIVIFCLYKIYQHKTFYFYPLAICFGLFSSFHPIQFPFLLIFLILLLVWKRTIPLLTLGISLMLFILPNIPLILFDYWRNWAMVNQLLSMFAHPMTGENLNFLSKLMGTVNVINDFFAQLAYIQLSQKTISPLIFLTLITLGMLILRKQKDTQFHYSAWATSFSIFILYYTFLPVHVPEYYLGGLRVFIIIYLSFLLSLSLQYSYLKGLTVIFLIYISARNGQDYYRQLTNEKLQTLYHKRIIVQKIIELSRNEPFAVSYITLPGWSSGFQSLFRLYGIDNPSNGQVFSIVTPLEMINGEDIDFRSGGIGLVYPDQFIEHQKLK